MSNNTVFSLKSDLKEGRLLGMISIKVPLTLPSHLLPIFTLLAMSQHKVWMRPSTVHEAQVTALKLNFETGLSNIVTPSSSFSPKNFTSVD